MRFRLPPPLILPLLVAAAARFAAAAPLAPFTGPTDIGAVNHATVAAYDRTTDTYSISASGDNIWGERDAFGFIWTPTSGDVALAADISFVGISPQPHRKACLMFRQSLEPDAPYVDVAVHGDGLASLQFRLERGGPTREVRSAVNAPSRVRLEKRGDYVYLSIARDGGALEPSGCMVRLPLKDPFYAGLAVCAHDAAAIETARFARVELGPAPAAPAERTFAIEVLPLASLDRRVVHRSPVRVESPHFSRDGSALFFNREGRIYRLDLRGGGEPVAIDTDFATHCISEHGLSPDGTTLVIGDTTEIGAALMYFVPVTGGKPRRVPAVAPAFWHSWSPDGGTLAYCAPRQGNFDVYTLAVEGGGETRLTDAVGHDNGPDFTPDGAWIYFHSNRTGSYQIWRMRPDGSNQEPVTDDDYQNWFPHPSPDGRFVVILSGEHASDDGRPPDGDYLLRLLPVDGGEPREIARFHGGQGSLNVPCWSPDGSSLAFVSYEPDP